MPRSAKQLQHGDRRGFRSSFDRSLRAAARYQYQGKADRRPSLYRRHGRPAVAAASAPIPQYLYFSARLAIYPIGTDGSGTDHRFTSGRQCIDGANHSCRRRRRGDVVDYRGGFLRSLFADRALPAHQFFAAGLTLNPRGRRWHCDSCSEAGGRRRGRRIRAELERTIGQCQHTADLRTAGSVTVGRSGNLDLTVGWPELGRRTSLDLE